jgi:hypothetical protein
MLCSEGECAEAKALSINSAKEGFVCKEFKITINEISCEIEEDMARCKCEGIRGDKEFSYGYGLTSYEGTWLIDHFFKVLQPPIFDLKTPFENYVDEIPEIKIPYNSNSNFESLDINSEFKSKEALLHGKLKSVNKHHFIVYWYAADISLPILEVYSNQGEKVNEVQLLDYHFCSFEYPNQYSRFKIETEGEVILENYRIIDEVENVVASDTIFIKNLIK